MPLYEIEKGARPPRWIIRMHYIKTREMLEARIPAVANLPRIQEKIPGVPSGAPTRPSAIWSRIIYPYDIAMQLAGYAPGVPSPTPTPARVKTV